MLSDLVMILMIADESYAAGEATRKSVKLKQKQKKSFSKHSAAKFSTGTHLFARVPRNRFTFSRTRQREI
jgi:hypothetical protein